MWAWPPAEDSAEDCRTIAFVVTIGKSIELVFVIYRQVKPHGRSKRLQTSYRRRLTLSLQSSAALPPYLARSLAEAL